MRVCFRANTREPSALLPKTASAEEMLSFWRTQAMRSSAASQVRLYTQLQLQLSGSQTIVTPVGQIAMHPPPEGEEGVGSGTGPDEGQVPPSHPGSPGPLELWPVPPVSPPSPPVAPLPPSPLVVPLTPPPLAPPPPPSSLSPSSSGLTGPQYCPTGRQVFPYCVFEGQHCSPSPQDTTIVV